jgi:DNA-binding NarL/FixJ family response regulator
MADAWEICMRILVADDHQLFRSGLSLLLSNIYDDVTVVEAVDIEAALARIESEAPVDLVLLDVDMPGMEGMAGLPLILERVPETPVVIISAIENSEEVFRAIGMGARGYILKSSSEHVLQHAISLAMSGETYIPSGIFMDSSGRFTGGGTESGWNGDPGIPLSRLTPRQRDVLTCLMDGSPNKEIARELGLLESTVKAHVKAILKKLGAANRTQASMIASRHGMMPHRAKDGTYSAG